MTTTEPEAQVSPRRARHVARSARILSTGITATAILGITAAFGAAERATNALINPGTSIPPSPTFPVTNLPTLQALGSSPPETQLPSTNIALASPGTLTPTEITSPVVTVPTPVVTVPTSVVTVIAPAEAPVMLTIPPAPSDASSGGSH